ncbi:putative NBD/HSP70 family sugar kinase [Kribbella sp. VKM Ac-2527]|uniref:Putative NBD/HSP70 family sugar kinase n=2 Tax=Kribbella caucasensis TaxID=2512215 RepID=A0A4R6KNL8_9ACTN|nr:putative NBD/HSP70 family sugar kinase [Kribbella sp. VKM Ac-2527]
MTGAGRNDRLRAAWAGVSTAPESQTVNSLRQRNRASALQFILRQREATRADVARHCGLSVASATNMVNDLMADGLVVESGTVASRGGRPITVIAPNSDGAYAIGADVGERGVAVELFDLGLQVVDREFRGGRQEESPEDIEQDLRDAIGALRARNAERWGRVLGVGLGLPGVVETSADGEQTLYAQSLGWAPRPIPGATKDGLPVFGENGAKTLARAEMWFGAARDIEHAAVALLGRGVGLAIVNEGKLFRGAFGSATEWGHTKIRYGGEPCRCGDRGCLEAYVGADALLAAWRRTGGAFEGSGWQAIGALCEAAETDDAAARVLGDGIEALGAALGSIVNLANPQRIVVGGWVGLRLMERHGQAITEAIRRNCLIRAGEQFDLVAATFGGDTVALGSALMPIEALIHAPRN